MSPHVLRHTLLRKVANENGLHYSIELSGHRSDRYIWRYVKPDEQSLADAIDDLHWAYTTSGISHAQLLDLSRDSEAS